jgi:hypothetical protein
MSASPQRPSPPDWESIGEGPTQSARHSRSGKVGLALVGLVLVALLVAVVLLFVL